MIKVYSSSIYVAVMWQQNSLVRVKRKKIPRKAKTFFFFLQNYFRNTIVKYLCVLCYVVGLVAEANFIVSQNQKKKQAYNLDHQRRACSNLFKHVQTGLFQIVFQFWLTAISCYEKSPIVWLLRRGEGQKVGLSRVELKLLKHFVYMQKNIF